MRAIGASVAWISSAAVASGTKQAASLARALSGMESVCAEPFANEASAAARLEVAPIADSDAVEGGAADDGPSPSRSPPVVPKAEDHCDETNARGDCNDGTADVLDGASPPGAESEADPRALCRICMAPTVSINLFEDGGALRMCEKVMSCAAVQVCQHDGLPDGICQSCVDDLEIAYNFKARCEKSDALLREKLGLKTKTIVKTEFVLIDCEDEVADRATRRSRAKKRIGDDFVEEEDFSVQETDDPSYETVPKKRKVRRKRKSIVPKSNKHEKKLKESEEDDDDDDVILVQKATEVPPKKRKSYPCPHCDKTFPYPSVLKVHAVIHTKKKEHKCVLCPEAFVYTKELYAHYKIAHPNETGKQNNDDTPKTYPCSMCDKVFGESKNLKVHEAMHTREKKYTCEGCSLGFTNMTVLNSHKKQEHPELCRPYACSMCNRSFKSQSALERHVECHKANESTKPGDKKPPLVKDLFKSIAPLTTTYWSDSFSD